MADSKSGPSKHTIIDALVLACSHSRIAEVVGTDALRSVLDVEYRELIADGSFNLQPIWELFEDQPGFNPEAAAAPLCRFKAWEKQLGIGVSLPAQLRNLSQKEQADLAADCEVPTSALRKALRGAHIADAREQAAKAERKRRVSAPNAEPIADFERPSRLRIIQNIAAVIAVVSFGLAGFSIYHSCAPSADYDAFSFPITDDLPVTDVGRSGTEVRATLTDASWLNRPDEEKDAALRKALRQVEDQGVQVLFLRDKSGHIRAIAQLHDDGRKIRIVYR